MLYFLRLSRPYNTLLPLVAIVAGYTISAAHNLGTLILTMILFAVLHGVVTIWNDFADEAGDKFNHIHRVAQVRKQGHYQSYKAILNLLTIVCLGASFWLPLGAQLLLVSYVIVGWIYNSPPLRLCTRPIASMICMFLGYGLIPFLLGGSLGHWSGQVIGLSLAWAGGRLSLSLLKDYKDATGDAKAAKKTFLLVFGHRWTSRISFGLLLTSLIAIVTIAGKHHHGYEHIAVIALAIWLLVERAKLFTRQEYAGLHAVFRDGLRYQLAFDLVVVAWLRIS